MIGFLLAGSLRIFIPLSAAWAICRLLRSRDAASRHTVWALGLLSSVSLLILPLVLPAWQLPQIPATVADAVSSARGMEDSSAFATVLTVTWLIGAAFFFALFAGSIVRIRGWIGQARGLPDTHRVARLASCIGRTREVRVRLTERTSVPFVWGVLRPTIVLPAEATTWSEADVRSTIVHELGHARRGDPWLRLMGESLRVVFWFHPLVWLCLSRLREESEATCDALVLADGRRRSAYARQLLALGTPERTGPRPALCPRTRSGLRRRIERVLAGTDGAPLSSGLHHALALIFVAGTLTVASASPGNPHPGHFVAGGAGSTREIVAEIEREVERERTREIRSFAIGTDTERRVRRAP